MTITITYERGGHVITCGTCGWLRYEAGPNAARDRQREHETKCKGGKR